MMLKDVRLFLLGITLLSLIGCGNKQSVALTDEAEKSQQVVVYRLDSTDVDYDLSNATCLAREFMEPSSSGTFFVSASQFDELSSSGFKEVSPPEKVSRDTGKYAEWDIGPLQGCTCHYTRFVMIGNKAYIENVAAINFRNYIEVRSREDKIRFNQLQQAERLEEEGRKQRQQLVQEQNEKLLLERQAINEYMHR